MIPKLLDEYWIKWKSLDLLKKSVFLILTTYIQNYNVFLHIFWDYFSYTFVYQTDNKLQKVVW